MSNVIDSSQRVDAEEVAAETIVRLLMPLQGNFNYYLVEYPMTSTGDLRVSSRGQMSLPSPARHRWGLDKGGDVGYLDLGDAIIIVPGGTTKLRQQLLDAVTADDWDMARRGFGDEEMANE